MPLQVLIVDDSPSMRKVIARVLRMSNYGDVVCHEASDGLEALSMLVTLRVDLILTDINMPHMNGEELIERLARSGKGLPAPILVVSTDQSEERVSRMLGLGVRGYVTKPFTPESLNATLVNILENRTYARPVL